MKKVSGKCARALVAELERLGLTWRVKTGRSRHYKFLITLPCGGTHLFVVSRSSSDFRSSLNMIKRLHRTIRQGQSA